MSRSYSRASSGVGGQIGCFILVLLLNCALGAWTLNYVLASIVGKTIPTLPAVIIGLFLGEFTVPAAIICWLLRLVGLHAPFVHL